MIGLTNLDCIIYRCTSLYSKSPVKVLPPYDRFYYLAFVRFLEQSYLSFYRSQLTCCFNLLCSVFVGIDTQGSCYSIYDHNCFSVKRMRGGSFSEGRSEKHSVKSIQLPEKGSCKIRRK